MIPTITLHDVAYCYDILFSCLSVAFYTQRTLLISLKLNTNHRHGWGAGYVDKPFLIPMVTESTSLVNIRLWVLKGHFSP